MLLLEWVRNSRGRWEGHVAWLTHRGTWRSIDVWLPGDELEPIAGQEYRRVPRRHADDMPF